LNVLDNACVDGCNWCCDWVVKKETTKTLTFARGLPAMKVVDSGWSLTTALR
jgi:hypothetical protein